MSSIHELLKQVYPLKLRMELFNAIWFNWRTDIKEKDQQITDLEAKLAESERKAYSRGHSQRDIANEIKLNALREDVANKEKRIVELKQQLAEKDKEISEVLAKQSITCLNTIEKAYQDKISFALEQLEQLKKLCQEKFNWWENSEWDGNIYDKSDVSNAYFDIEANIDQQINELKGRVEDE